MDSLTLNEFLSSGSGYGYGDGYGDGYGYGYGSGYGYGDGSGYGSGYGYGYGSGSGYGYGDGDGDGSGSGYPEVINGERVYPVDGVPTVIRHIRGNIAKGAIVRCGLQLEDCFVVKQDGHFAHGKTLAEAMEALRDKLFEDMPEEERIAAFVDAHKDGVLYPVMDFFDWHHRLTGSCEMGRRAFAERHDIDLDGSMTTESFIALTEHDYGGDVIQKLKPYYGM